MFSDCDGFYFGPAMTEEEAKSYGYFAHHEEVCVCDIGIFEVIDEKFNPLKKHFAQDIQILNKCVNFQPFSHRLKNLFLKTKNLFLKTKKNLFLKTKNLLLKLGPYCSKRLDHMEMSREDSKFITFASRKLG